MPTTRGEVHELAAQLLLLRDRMIQHVAAMPTSALDKVPEGVRVYILTLVDVIKVTRAGVLANQHKAPKLAEQYRRTLYEAAYELAEVFQ
jgi:hypothetical protein